MLIIIVICSGISLAIALKGEVSLFLADHIFLPAECKQMVQEAKVSKKMSPQE